MHPFGTFLVCHLTMFYKRKRQGLSLFKAASLLPCFNGIDFAKKPVHTLKRDALGFG